MSEFVIGDVVMHFRDGLSEIVGETKMNDEAYFLVRLRKENGETVYVPVARASSVIRHIVTKEEIIELFKYLKTIEPEYVTNTKQRRDNFKRKLGSGSIFDLGYLAVQLYYYNHPEILKVPVKFGPADLEMLKYANKTMYDEIAISYNVDRDKIEEFIIGEVKASNL